MPERDPKTGRFPRGSGIPAGGAGYGGPKKGEGKRVSLDEVRALRWDADNLASKEEVAAQMRAVLYQVALNGEAEAARINAADKLLDRIEGKPVVKQDIKLRTTNPDEMTDEELAAIVAAGRSRAASGASGD